MNDISDKNINEQVSGNTRLAKSKLKAQKLDIKHQRAQNSNSQSKLKSKILDCKLNDNNRKTNRSHSASVSFKGFFNLASMLKPHHHKWKKLKSCDSNGKVVSPFKNFPKARLNEKNSSVARNKSVGKGYKIVDNDDNLKRFSVCSLVDNKDKKCSPEFDVIVPATQEENAGTIVICPSDPAEIPETQTSDSSSPTCCHSEPDEPKHQRTNVRNQNHSNPVRVSNNFIDEAICTKIKSNNIYTNKVAKVKKRLSILSKMNIEFGKVDVPKHLKNICVSGKPSRCPSDLEKSDEAISTKNLSNISITNNMKNRDKSKKSVTHLDQSDEAITVKKLRNMRESGKVKRCPSDLEKSDEAISTENLSNISITNNMKNRGKSKKSVTHLGKSDEVISTKSLRNMCVSGKGKRCRSDLDKSDEAISTENLSNVSITNNIENGGKSKKSVTHLDKSDEAISAKSLRTTCVSGKVKSIPSDLEKSDEAISTENLSNVSITDNIERGSKSKKSVTHLDKSDEAISAKSLRTTCVSGKVKKCTSDLEKSDDAISTENLSNVSITNNIENWGKSKKSITHLDKSDEAISTENLSNVSITDNIENRGKSKKSVTHLDESDEVISTKSLRNMCVSGKGKRCPSDLEKFDEAISTENLSNVSITDNIENGDKSKKSITHLDESDEAISTENLSNVSITNNIENGGKSKKSVTHLDKSDEVISTKSSRTICVSGKGKRCRSDLDKSDEAISTENLSNVSITNNIENGGKSKTSVTHLDKSDEAISAKSLRTTRVSGKVKSIPSDLEKSDEAISTENLLNVIITDNIENGGKSKNSVTHLDKSDEVISTKSLITMRMSGKVKKCTSDLEKSDDAISTENLSNVSITNNIENWGKSKKSITQLDESDEAISTENLSNVSITNNIENRGKSKKSVTHLDESDEAISTENLSNVSITDNIERGSKSKKSVTHLDESDEVISTKSLRNMHGSGKVKRCPSNLEKSDEAISTENLSNVSITDNIENGGERKYAAPNLRKSEESISTENLHESGELERCFTDLENLDNCISTENLSNVSVNNNIENGDQQTKSARILGKLDEAIPTKNLTNMCETGGLENMDEPERCVSHLEKSYEIGSSEDFVNFQDQNINCQKIIITIPESFSSDNSWTIDETGGSDWIPITIQPEQAFIKPFFMADNLPEKNHKNSPSNMTITKVLRKYRTRKSLTSCLTSDNVGESIDSPVRPNCEQMILSSNRKDASKSTSITTEINDSDEGNISMESSSHKDIPSTRQLENTPEKSLCLRIKSPDRVKDSFENNEKRVESSSVLDDSSDSIIFNESFLVPDGELSKLNSSEVLSFVLSCENTSKDLEETRRLDDKYVGRKLDEFSEFVVTVKKVKSLHNSSLNRKRVDPNENSGVIEGTFDGPAPVRTGNGEIGIVVNDDLNLTNRKLFEASKRSNNTNSLSGTLLTASLQPIGVSTQEVKKATKRRMLNSCEPAVKKLFSNYSLANSNELSEASKIESPCKKVKMPISQERLKHQPKTKRSPLKPKKKLSKVKTVSRTSIASENIIQELNISSKKQNDVLCRTDPEKNIHTKKKLSKGTSLPEEKSNCDSSNDSTNHPACDLPSSEDCTAEGSSNVSLSTSQPLSFDLKPVRDIVDENVSDEIKVKKLRKYVNKLYKIPPHVLDKIKTLVIDITWPIPPAHLRKTVTKRPYTNLESQLGCWDETDCERIMSRWKEFCEKYGFEDNDFRAFVPNPNKYLSTEQKYNFVLFLAQDFPLRPLHSVYFKFEELCCKFIKGRFSPEEDELIWTLYNKNNQKDNYALCAAILKRSRYAIYRRHKRLLRNTITVPRTNYEKSHVILNKLIEAGNCSSKEDFLKFQSETLETGNVSHLTKRCRLADYALKKIWITKLSPRLFGSEPVLKNDFYTRLINVFVECRWKTWEDVKLSEHSEKLYNFDPIFLYLTFRKLVIKYVPSEHWDSLTECVEHLKKEVLTKFAHSAEECNHILRQLVIKDGVLYQRRLL